MSNNGKIYITISDKRGTDGPSPTPTLDSNKEKESGNLFGDFAKHQFFSFIQSEAKQAINYTLGNIGNFTGNYNTQRDVNNAMAGLNKVMGLPAAIMAGAQFGPGGMAITGGLYVATLAVNAVFEDISLSTQIRKQNTEIDRLRQRSGLDTLTNGGRGTEN